MLPPIIPGSSIRLENILLLPFFIIWLSTNQLSIIIPKFYKPLIIFFGLIAFSILIALVLQFILIKNSNIQQLLHNYYGFLRTLIFFLLSINLIKNKNDILLYTRIIIFGIIYQGFLIIIEYINFPILTEIINLLYRGGSEIRIGNRGLGGFDRVHSAAFFGLYAFIFCFGLTIFGYKKLKKGAYTGIIFSFFLIILPFSRASILALFALTIVLTFYYRKSYFVKIYWFLIILLILNILIFSNTIRNELEYLFYSIKNGILYIIDDNLVSDLASIGFITGRIEWGWMNAIENWMQYPITGNLLVAKNEFIGDGGFTESLSNHGLIGFLGMLLAIILLPFNHFKDFQKTVNLKNLKRIFILYSVSICICMLASGFLLERSIELLPVMFVLLYKIFFDIKNVNNKIK